jgi:hypothetical protein
MMSLPEPVTAVVDAGIEFIYSFAPLAEKTVVLGTTSVQKVGLLQPKLLAGIWQLLGSETKTSCYRGALTHFSFCLFCH